MHLRFTTCLGIGLLFLVPMSAPADPALARGPTLPAKAAPQLPSLLQECCALAARKIPYVYGGSSDQGMDCSASVQRLYKSRGISLPRTSEGQANALAKRGQLWRVAKGESEIDVFERLQPGELLFWVKDGSPDRVSHVMVFIGMDGSQPRLWGARGTGKTGLTGSGVDFFHYGVKSHKKSRLVAHGKPQ